MSEKAKAPIVLIILTLMLMISLALAGVTYINLQKESAKSAALQEELNSTKEAQKILESKMDEARKTIQGYESKLKDNLAQIISLGKDLQQEKSQKEEALSQVDRLKTDLQQQQSLRSDLENKFTRAQQEAKNMQAQLNALEGKKAELEVKLKELEEKSQNQGVELGTIVVAPETAAAPVKAEPAKKAEPSKKSEKPAAKKQAREPQASGGMEGKVLVVNKDYNFAVISLGNKDGINIGNTFAVYHNNKYLGDVKVEKVHDSMAAAGFSSEDMRNKVSEGDKVVSTTK
jgi:DNA repair exonuclease SbcCD ATPase subunit